MLIFHLVSCSNSRVATFDCWVLPHQLTAKSLQNYLRLETFISSLVTCASETILCFYPLWLLFSVKQVTPMDSVKLHSTCRDAGCLSDSTASAVGSWAWRPVRPLQDHLIKCINTITSDQKTTGVQQILAAGFPPTCLSLQVLFYLSNLLFWSLR